MIGTDSLPKREAHYCRQSIATEIKIYDQLAHLPVAILPMTAPVALITGITGQNGA